MIGFDKLSSTIVEKLKEFMTSDRFDKEAWF
jgi:hypothetical protein